jgi:hypothetical protein
MLPHRSNSSSARDPLPRPARPAASARSWNITNTMSPLIADSCFLASVGTMPTSMRGSDKRRFAGVCNLSAQSSDQRLENGIRDYQPSDPRYPEKRLRLRDLEWTAQNYFARPMERGPLPVPVAPKLHL